MRPTARLKSEAFRACRAGHLLRPSSSSTLTAFCHRYGNLLTPALSPIQLPEHICAKRKFTSSARLSQDESKIPRPIAPSRPQESTESTTSQGGLTDNSSPPASEALRREESSTDANTPQNSSQSRRDSRIESLLDSYAARRKAAAEETASALASMTITSAGPPITPPADAEVAKLPPLRLKPSLGRTIPIDRARGVDIGRALGLLGMRLAKNRVKADMQAQKFHERPGLKRKRLRTERRERRFLRKYSEMKQKVLYMVRKGY